MTHWQCFSELPSDTLAVLQDFYSDRESREKSFQDLKLEIEDEGSHAQLSMDMFSEDWNASQFWVYNHGCRTSSPIDALSIVMKRPSRWPSSYSMEPLPPHISVLCRRQVFSFNWGTYLSVSRTNLTLGSSWPSVSRPQECVKLLKFPCLSSIIASLYSKSSSTMISSIHWHCHVCPRRLASCTWQLTLREDDFQGKYDRIVCDPPFLSPHCQTKGLDALFSSDCPGMNAKQ